MRKNYTPAERALHIIGALAGKSLDEINEAVTKGDELKSVSEDCRKELPESSLDMLKRKYAASLTPTLLWDHCVAPKKVGDL